MKKIKFLLPIILSVLLAAYIGRAPKKKTLPYYNTPDFTPQWISTADKEFAGLHRIAPFSFTNQNGERITNEQVAGKIYVASFFFTTCGSICPKMMANLKKVNAAFAQNDRVLILSHTVLPETDRVQRLKAYAQSRGTDNPHWWLLTGNRQDIYRLARTSYFADDTLGYNSNGIDFLHTENCVLVDGNGHLRGVYNATLELEMNKLIKDIKTLTEE